jgi:hypothetical protein
MRILKYSDWLGVAFGVIILVVLFYAWGKYGAVCLVVGSATKQIPSPCACYASCVPASAAVQPGAGQSWCCNNPIS